eukprot:360045-Chlamydomonas_euryale.AAC.6
MPPAIGTAPRLLHPSHFCALCSIAPRWLTCAPPAPTSDAAASLLEMADLCPSRPHLPCWPNSCGMSGLRAACARLLATRAHSCRQELRSLPACATSRQGQRTALPTCTTCAAAACCIGCATGLAMP